MPAMDITYSHEEGLVANPPLQFTDRRDLIIHGELCRFFGSKHPEMIELNALENVELFTSTFHGSRCTITITLRGSHGYKVETKVETGFPLTELNPVLGDITAYLALARISHTSREALDTWKALRRRR